MLDFDKQDNLVLVQFKILFSRNWLWSLKYVSVNHSPLIDFYSVIFSFEKLSFQSGFHDPIFNSSRETIAEHFLQIVCFVFSLSVSCQKWKKVLQSRMLRALVSGATVESVSYQSWVSSVDCYSFVVWYFVRCCHESKMSSSCGGVVVGLPLVRVSVLITHFCFTSLLFFCFLRTTC